MLPRKENIIIAKSDVYSNRILKLYQYLTDVKHEFVISKQIVRSGTSIQYESMYQDNDEIVKILTKIIKTMKSKL